MSIRSSVEAYSTEEKMHYKIFSLLHANKSYLNILWKIGIPRMGVRWIQQKLESVHNKPDEARTTVSAPVVPEGASESSRGLIIVPGTRCCGQR